MLGIRKGTVRLVPYDPAWKDVFAEEAARLELIFGQHMLALEHIGSTAVDGMEAKPIIDMIVAIEHLNFVGQFVPQLQAQGYEDRGESGFVDRRFFAKGPPECITHHLSVTELRSMCWTRIISFRDYLRRHTEVAEEYLELKRSLAKLYADDVVTYSKNKDAFVDYVFELSTTKSIL